MESDLSWQAEAKCNGLDPDYFYPEGLGHHENNKNALELEAAQFCKGCPVKQACLEYAVATNQFGVWGGTSEKQRRRLRRRHEIFSAAM